MKPTITACVLALAAFAVPQLAEAEEVDAQIPPGYVDDDRDGVNDRFRDADGDGVNDLNGQAYPHRFGFVDVDQDGVNDLFVDADGDGVNDRDGGPVDADGDGICDNVVDADGDGRNDITGREYGADELGGWRFGRIDEEAGEMADRFVDEDGDGVHDAWAQRAGRGRSMDRFIDEDGDGIADGRTVRGRVRLAGDRSEAGRMGRGAARGDPSPEAEQDGNGQQRRRAGRGGK